MSRKSLSKRTRFEIFKRDGFQCVYCGVTPDRAILRVDHVQPVAEGGGDEPENLVTACFDCNAGKGPVPLEERKHSVGKATDEAKEQPEQIREWLALQREVKAAKTEVVAVLEEQWNRTVGYVSRDLQAKLPGMVQEFGAERMAQAIEIVAEKQLDNASNQVRYLCGILRKWRERRERKESVTQSGMSVAVEREWTERDEIEAQINGFVAEFEEAATFITQRSALPFFRSLLSSMRRMQMHLDLTVGMPMLMNRQPWATSAAGLEAQERLCGQRIGDVSASLEPEVFDCGGGI